MDSLPGVPTVAEVHLKGLETIPPYTYFGLAGPANLPPPIVAQLNDAFTRISAMPDVVKRL
ncbi:tripartite tricarboxylate transporter substrate-binding protein [Rhodoferax sediminis]|uniref:Uncharacterized protein n=1 Tax=Rhodoferax sediminis TaxID=2509614 RepID=A0A515DE67_9BURK|nr:hypothetical protein EUB48_16215 [Rhodoferax sediminis]